ncbi:MAG: hypothetical protein J5680_04530, partial [Neisseriaceae bacterium]|nr:hypothetical protein [Neisseriaceae bacterium]
ANKPISSNKQFIFSLLEQNCNKYIQSKLGKSPQTLDFDFPLESSCIVLGRNNTYGKETTQAYKKLKSMTEAERMQLVKKEKQTATPGLCTSLSDNDLALSLTSQETREAQAGANALFGALLGDKFKEGYTQLTTQLSTQMNQQMASWTGANLNASNYSPNEIFQSCQPACSQKNGKACTFMGIILNKKKQFAQAEPYLKQGCNSGYGMGCIALERFHYHENQAMSETPKNWQTCRYVNGVKTDCSAPHHGSWDPGYTIQRTGEISTVIKGRKPNKATALQYRQKGLALFKKACQQGDSEACSNYKYYSNLDRAILGGDYVGWER